MTIPYPAKADLADLIATLEQAIAEVSPREAPRLLGDLERLKVSLLARMLIEQTRGNNQTPEGEDRLLAVEEAAEKLGVPNDWLYRHAKKLPFTVRLGPRHLRFSARGIERYIRQRQGR